MSIAVTKEWTFCYNGIIPKESRKDRESVLKFIQSVLPVQVVLPNQTPLCGQPIRDFNQLMPSPLNRAIVERREHANEDHEAADGEIPQRRHHLVLVPPQSVSAAHVDTSSWDKKVLLISLLLSAIILIYHTIALIQYSYNYSMIFFNIITLILYAYTSSHLGLMSLTLSGNIAMTHAAYYAFILQSPIHIIHICFSLMVHWRASAYRSSIIHSWFVPGAPSYM